MRRLHIPANNSFQRPYGSPLVCFVIHSNQFVRPSDACFI